MILEALRFSRWLSGLRARAGPGRRFQKYEVAPRLGMRTVERRLRKGLRENGLLLLSPSTRTNCHECPF